MKRLKPVLRLFSLQSKNTTIAQTSTSQRILVSPNFYKMCKCVCLCARSFMFSFCKRLSSKGIESKTKECMYIKLVNEAAHKKTTKDFHPVGNMPCTSCKTFSFPKDFNKDCGFKFLCTQDTLLKKSCGLIVPINRLFFL